MGKRKFDIPPEFFTIGELLPEEERQTLYTWLEAVYQDGTRIVHILRDCQLKARDALDGKRSQKHLREALESIDGAISANYPSLDDVGELTKDQAESTIKQLVNEGILIQVPGSNSYQFTEKGHEYAQQMVQADPETRDLLRRLVNGDADLPDNTPDIIG